VIYLTPELARLLAEQLARVRALERKTGRIIPYLFPYLGGRQRIGQQRRDFRKAWATAFTKAGVPGMLRHDFRRTAVRNIVNDGTPEKVAMMITGHKTRAVFDGYHIVAPEDLKPRRPAWRPGTGTFPGTFGPLRLTAVAQLAKIQGRACSSVG
jgi:integrase